MNVGEVECVEESCLWSYWRRLKVLEGESVLKYIELCQKNWVITRVLFLL